MGGYGIVAFANPQVPDGDFLAAIHHVGGEAVQGGLIVTRSIHGNAGVHDPGGGRTGDFDPGIHVTAQGKVEIRQCHDGVHPDLLTLDDEVGRARLRSAIDVRQAAAHRKPAPLVIGLVDSANRGGHGIHMDVGPVEMQPDGFRVHQLVLETEQFQRIQCHDPVDVAAVPDRTVHVDPAPDVPVQIGGNHLEELPQGRHGQVVHDHGRRVSLAGRKRLRLDLRRPSQIDRIDKIDLRSSQRALHG